MQVRTLSVLVALILLSTVERLDGWQPRAGTVTVHEDTNGVVYFRFFQAPELHKGRLVPREDNMFGVYRKGQPTEPLWWITGKEPRNGVEMVTYGVVPEIFQQHIPVSGEPPKLEAGQDYCASGHSLRVCFTYLGPLRQ